MYYVNSLCNNFKLLDIIEVEAGGTVVSVGEVLNTLIKSLTNIHISSPVPLSLSPLVPLHILFLFTFPPVQLSPMSQLSPLSVPLSVPLSSYPLVPLSVHLSASLSVPRYVPLSNCHHCPPICPPIVLSSCPLVPYKNVSLRQVHGSAKEPSLSGHSKSGQSSSPLFTSIFIMT